MENKEFSAVKTQKKLFRFNITDVFLIIVIIAAASVLIYIVTGTGLLSGGEEVTILYTIEMGLVRNEFLPAINKIMPGDKITDSVRSYDIGEIQQVRISAGMVDATNRTKGIVERKPHPDHSRVLITVKAKAKREGNAETYLVNGRLKMAGVQMYFSTPHFMGYGMCIEIEEITEE